MKSLLFVMSLLIVLTFGCNSSNSNENQPVENKSLLVEKRIKIGDNYGGGIVFYIDSTGEHGLVCQYKDLGELVWDEAVKSCKDLGDGWYLPNLDELNLMYTNLHKKGLGGFAGLGYWSSTERKPGVVWFRNFGSGYQYSADNTGRYISICRVRAVRAF